MGWVYKYFVFARLRGGIMVPKALPEVLPRIKRYRLHDRTGKWVCESTDPRPGHALNSVRGTGYTPALAYGAWLRAVTCHPGPFYHPETRERLKIE